MMFAVDNKDQILSHHQAIGHMDSVARKQPMIALYFESENELKFYNLEA